MSQKLFFLPAIMFSFFRNMHGFSNHSLFGRLCPGRDSPAAGAGRGGAYRVSSSKYASLSQLLRGVSKDFDSYLCLHLQGTLVQGVKKQNCPPLKALFAASNVHHRLPIWRHLLVSPRYRVSSMPSVSGSPSSCPWGSSSFFPVPPCGPSQSCASEWRLERRRHTLLPTPPPFSRPSLLLEPSSFLLSRALADKSLSAP